MKKITNKSSTSPAPATNAAPAATPANVTKATPKKKAPAQPVAVAPAPAAAPQVQPVAPAPVPVVKAVAPKRVAAPKPTPAAAPVAPTPTPAVAVVAPKAAPVVAPVAPKPVTTKITAQIDIGFGNALYLRGEGSSLSWDKGIVMDCVADDQWSLVLAESPGPVIFKFLVNDLSWSAGPNYTVEPGADVTLVPTF